MYYFTYVLISIQQLNELTLLTFFAMALDFIPIQASVVPSKRMFLSSTETDTKNETASTQY